MSVLLLVLDALQYAYAPVATALGSTAPRVFYVFEGVTAMVLFLVVALACRGWIYRGLALLGAADHSLVSGCGSLDLFTPTAALGPLQGLCDRHGVHAYRIGVVVLAWFAFMLAFKMYKEKHERSNSST